VTLACPDFVGSACEVAVTVTAGGLGTAVGAVYSPEVVIVPHAVPVQPVPETLQFTAVLVVPVTDALNCCFPAVETVAEAGDTETVMTGAMITVAEADLVGSAAEVAVTETTFGFGGRAGA
jgi:hypothetical protein